MKRLWFYIIIIDLLALALTINAIKEVSELFIFTSLIVCALVTIAELYPLDIFDEGDLTLSALINIVFLLVFGLDSGLMGIIMGVILFGIIKRRPVQKTLFNAGQAALSLAISYYLFILIGGKDGIISYHSFIIPFTYVFVNTLLVGLVLAIYHNINAWHAWMMLNNKTLPYNIIINMGGLAFGGLILAYKTVGAVLFVILVLCLWVVLYQAGNSISAMKIRFKETITVLMKALEFRDPYTRGHSDRVAYWCRKIAEELKLYPSEIEKIELGGLMHDVGKVGVPDYILNKPGQLTKEEYDQVKNHPVIGEKILSELQGMDYIAAMARQHHLFFDGDPKGYAGDMSGREALIGSRILAIADAWDAMTGDRPYRKSLGVEQAVAELKRYSGSQFDPEIVEAFIRVLKTEKEYQE